MGRPSIFSQDLVDAICERLCDGVPLAEICRADGMPSVSTVWDWRQTQPGVSDSIARARDIGFDTLATRLMLTAQGKTEDEGGLSSGDVQRDKLIVDTILKLLAKWDPKRYGELLKLSGAGGDGPIPLINITAEMTAAAGG
jgi:hypothetical protein